MSSAIVLLSSGLDSTVNLHHFHRRGEVALALTIDYGQKSARREVEHAAHQCQKLGVAHEVVELSFFKSFKSSSLFQQSDQAVPQLQAETLEDLARVQSSAKSVWVPNRNGLFLNLGACYAEEVGASTVVAGFNKEEAQTFPDNSAEFLDGLNHTLSYSTRSGVKVQSCTLNWSKSEIVGYGLKLGVDFTDVWPCYEGEEKPCSRCESCVRYLRATAGKLTDPRFERASG